MITLEHIVKQYDLDGSVINAVDDVSIHVEKGEIVGIVGFSGAGKSTLVRMINLLERPTSGKVFLQDTELTALKNRELRKQRRRIGMIFQQFQLFASRTVFENVAFPLRYNGLSKAEISDKVNRLLELVDLSDKAKAYPSELSGGQKQRVAVARALATDPEILLSDEATSALDPQATKSILNLLKKLNREMGITIVLITHEMDVVKEICDRVYVMERGKVVEEGDVFDIFSNPQKQITKNFVETTMNLSRIYDYIAEDSPLTRIGKNQWIVRFRYLEKQSSEPLVSELSRKYDLNINIIFGNIEFAEGHPIGGLVSIIAGEPENFRKALQYLKDINVGVEVIKDGNSVPADA